MKLDQKSWEKLEDAKKELNEIINGWKKKNLKELGADDEVLAALNSIVLQIFTKTLIK